MSNSEPSNLPSTTDPRPALVPVGRYASRASFSLDRLVTLIGSRQRADIRLESDEVSRSHAVIINTGGRVVIRDLASRTQVYVNGRQVHEAVLADGDHVNIGRFMLRFAAADVAAAGVPTARPPGSGSAILTGDGLESGGVSLNGTPCVVGCRAGVDVMLQGPDVSFAHALIFNDGGRYVVQDLGSRTGTFVDGRRVDGSAELRPGSLIRIGPYRIRYAPVAAGPVRVQDPLPAPVVTGSASAEVAGSAESWIPPHVVPPAKEPDSTATRPAGHESRSQPADFAEANHESAPPAARQATMSDWVLEPRNQTGGDPEAQPIVAKYLAAPAIATAEPAPVAGPPALIEALNEASAPRQPPVAADAEQSASSLGEDWFGEPPADPTTALVDEDQFTVAAPAGAVAASAQGSEVEELAPLAPAEPSATAPAPVAIEPTSFTSPEVASAEVMPIQPAAHSDVSAPDTSHSVAPELKTAEPEPVDALPAVVALACPGPDAAERVEVVAQFEAAVLHAPAADGTVADAPVEVFAARAVAVEAPVSVSAASTETLPLSSPADDALNTPEWVASALPPAASAPDPAEESDACDEFGVVLDAAEWRRLAPDQSTLAQLVAAPLEVIDPSEVPTDQSPDAPPKAPPNVPPDVPRNAPPAVPTSARGATDAVDPISPPSAPPAPLAQSRLTPHAEPTGRPPAKWGMLAVAVALAEMPHRMPPAAPSVGAEDGPPRGRRSRMLWYVVSVVILAAVAGATFLYFFNPAVADILRGYL